MEIRYWKCRGKNSGRMDIWEKTSMSSQYSILHWCLIFDLCRILNQMGCGDSFEGVAVGADMYHVQKVRAFIGPYCNTGERWSLIFDLSSSSELDAVAKMATFWNIPVIGYIASSNQFADKNIYKVTGTKGDVITSQLVQTLARVSTRTTNSLAEATAALLRHFRWERVS